MQKSKVNELTDLVKHLPIKLRKGLREDVLLAAIEENYISVQTDGKLRWMLDNKTLQAYFCGRMWCGDSCVYSKRTEALIWKQGSRHFPAKDLSDLFGVKGLRDLRKLRNRCNLPECVELIENLFLAE